MTDQQTAAHYAFWLRATVDELEEKHSTFETRFLELGGIQRKAIRAAAEYYESLAQSPPAALQEETPGYWCTGCQQHYARTLKYCPNCNGRGGKLVDEPFGTAEPLLITNVNDVSTSVGGAGTEDAMPDYVAGQVHFARNYSVEYVDNESARKSIVWLDDDRTRLVEALAAKDGALTVAFTTNDGIYKALESEREKVVQLEQQLAQKDSRIAQLEAEAEPDECDALRDQLKELSQQLAQSRTETENAAYKRAAESAHRENEQRALAQRLQFRVDELTQQIADAEIARNETLDRWKRIAND